MSRWTRLLLLFWLVRSEFDNVRDGFVYGALIGAVRDPRNVVDMGVVRMPHSA